ncbi:hypothetical protein [Pseudomonas sp. MWU13-3659]|uniref:hypothetical protein n=1 Tax=Pseudomonas sp. MWU13-3659 TaxID=2986964 RepID=UPI002074F0D8|nr:hypothetical protein [Pseudomonas sp. MWU13-3659]
MAKLKIDGREVDVNVGSGGAQFTLGDSTVKVDAEGNLLGAQAFGNTIERVEDGMVITRPSGAKMKMADDGTITLLTLPKSVGLLDLSKVTNYTIQGEGDSTVHQVTFADGGQVQLTYHQGQFASLSGHRVLQRLNEEHELFIGQSAEEKPALEA